MAEFVFREANNGELVRVRRGSVISLELEENSTTGYKWMAPMFDSALLTLESDEFQLPTRAAVGTGGTRKFVFRAEDVGEGTIQLIKKRSWQSDEQAVAKFALSIKIQSSA